MYCKNVGAQSVRNAVQEYQIAPLKENEGAILIARSSKKSLKLVNIYYFKIIPFRAGKSCDWSVKDKYYMRNNHIKINIEPFSRG